MPIVTPFIPVRAWETATLAIGPIILRWGAFLGDLINFIIIEFVVFIVAKMVLKEEKVEVDAFGREMITICNNLQAKQFLKFVVFRNILKKFKKVVWKLIIFHK